MKFHIIKRIALMLAMILGFSIIIMVLWNLLVPAIFRLAFINFWQALGLFVLARLLFGGIGGRFMGMGMHSHHNAIREKWMKMTPEERKEFVHHRHHHGYDFRSDFFNAEKPEKES